MLSPDDTRRQLLLSYVGLLAERHGDAPGDGFEFKLYRDIGTQTYKLCSAEEADELVYLMQATQQWVTYDLETRMFCLVPIQEFYDLLLEEDG